MKNKYIIVGEEFKNFAQIENVITTNEFKGEHGNSQYILGQGIGHDAIDKLKSAKCQNSVKYNNLASLKDTHKSIEKNIIITQPEKTAAQEFQCNLVVCKSNELITDHVTGYHLQGMVLIEAIRQTFVAVSEIFLKKFERQYVVFSSLDIKFIKFCFPLDASIKMTITNAKVEESSAKYEAQINILQAQNTVVESTVRFSLYDAISLKKIEKKKGIDKVNKMLETKT